MDLQNQSENTVTSRLGSAGNGAWAKSMFMFVLAFGVFVIIGEAGGWFLGVEDTETVFTQDLVEYFSDNSDSGTQLIQTQDSGTPEERVCKAGYNPGKEVYAPDHLQRAQETGLRSMVAIVNGNNSLNPAADFVRNANNQGITPIIRMCYNSQDLNHCSDFKDPNAAGKFVTDLQQQVGDLPFVFLAGPNEPVSERWILDSNNPIRNSDEVLPTNSPEFIDFFTRVGRYTKDMVAYVDTNSPNRDSVTMLGIGLNLDFHGCGGQTVYMNAYLDGLGGDLKILDGLAGNTYNIGEKRADTCYNFIRDNYLIGKIDDDFEFHITEFGPFEQNDKGPALKEAYEVLNGYPEVKTINFFTPFAEPGEFFARHRLSADEIRAITECEILDSNVPIEPGGIGAPPPEAGIEYVPYAPYYEDEYAAYSLNSCEKIDNNDPEKIEGWHRMRFAGGNFDGVQLVTAKVINFPQLNHFGSVEPFDPDLSDNASNLRSQALSPYDPICSVLVNSLGSNTLVTTIEHPGIMGVYTNGQRQNLAVSKLGSGVGCLNLFVNPLITRTANIRTENGVVPGINNPFAYKGFSYTEYSDEIRQEAYNAATNSVETTIIKQGLNLVTEYFGQVITNIQVIFGTWIEGSYERPPFPGEPIVEYDSSTTYCEESEDYFGPPIKHINTTANQPSEALTTGEHVIAMNRRGFNVDQYCSGDDTQGVVILNQPWPNKFTTCNAYLKVNGVVDKSFTLSELDVQFYDDDEIDWEPKPDNELRNLEVYFRSDIAAPDSISIPGGLSGYAKLYEEIQQQAWGLNHSLVAPHNGTIVSLQLKVYDPFREKREDLSGIEIATDELDLDPEDPYALAFTEFSDEVPYEVADSPSLNLGIVDIDHTYEFVIPFDLVPYFHALQYSYANTEQSEQFFVDYNLIIKKSGLLRIFGEDE